MQLWSHLCYSLLVMVQASHVYLLHYLLTIHRTLILSLVFVAFSLCFPFVSHRFFRVFSVCCPFVCRRFFRSFSACLLSLFPFFFLFSGFLLRITLHYYFRTFCYFQVLTMKGYWTYTEKLKTPSAWTPSFFKIGRAHV